MSDNSDYQTIQLSEYSDFQEFCATFQKILEKQAKIGSRKSHLQNPTGKMKKPSAKNIQLEKSNWNNYISICKNEAKWESPT